MAPKPSLRTDRATTLLEAMVALTILLVGILGTMQLQVVGLSANAGARAQTQATQLARELAAALERLSPEDPLVAAHFEADAAPPLFGRILVGPDTLTSAGYTAWSDSLVASFPGVQTDASVRLTYGSDPIDTALPRFQRRWQAWQMTTAATTAGVRVIAVSVTYREPRLPGLREVVLLTQVSNRGLSSSFAAAYR